MFHKPREMNRVWWKTWLYRRGCPSWRLRYIFLTEWQLCAKACGSRVPQSAQGTIKLTAPSAHAPQCLKYWGKVVVAARSLGCLIALRTKAFVTFDDRSKIAAFHSGPAWASVIHCQALADWSRLQRPCSLEARHRKHRWSGETELTSTEVQSGAGHVRTGGNKSWSLLGNRGTWLQMRRIKPDVMRVVWIW